MGRKVGFQKRDSSGHVDIQSEAMLKLRAALEGKLRSNGVFGSTVSKSDKAQKRQKLAKKDVTSKLETFDDYASNDDNEKHDDDMVCSDGKSEGSEDEFYKQVRQKRESKRAAKAEIYSREPSSTLFLPETVVGKRLISNEILGNRGLTRHRNKDKKNPRKNYRDKYTDKVKRRGGQVREIRKPSGSYGGERSERRHRSHLVYISKIRTTGVAENKSQRQGDWCIANAITDNDRLLNNIDFACSRVNCGIISQGGSCYDPNTPLYHASVAMNLYYQAQGRNQTQRDCSFEGTGLITITDPSYGSCKFEYRQ
ncbi:putative beta-1,3-glucanase [Hirschfeldia incana]|nr:putative beta-1,3-glucanase [Hirschfeldia incana]